MNRPENIPETPLRAEISVFTDNLPLLTVTEIVECSHLYILCQEGTGSFIMDDKEFHIFRDNIVMFPIGAMVKDLKFSKDFSALIMNVSRDYLLRNNPDPAWATKGYVYIKEYPVAQLTPDSTRMLTDMMHRIDRELCNRGHMFRSQIVGHLYQIFLYEIWEICYTEMQRRGHVSGPSSKMFADFLELARQNAAEHRDVSFYSEQLCVTAKYLSEVVKRCSGHPASYWINGYANQAISELLKQPDITIAEIAYKLNFFNPPHLCRFFKRTMGMAPSEYRNSLNIK